MRALLFMIALVVGAMWPSIGDALTCPNKPVSATTLATVHFNTSDGEGQLWEIYPGAGQIQSIAGAEGTVSASILSPGQSSGGQQTIWPKPGNQQPLNNIYVCFRWKMNAQFVGIRTANKLVFVAAQDWTYGKQGGNGFFGLGQVGGYPPTSFFMYFGHNSGNLDNSHACSADLGLGCNPNIATTSIVPDTWYTVEAYIISSSSTTSRNGTLKWWINGTLNGQYTNLNYIDGITNQFQINHTWDNSSAIQCYNATTNPLGRDCTNPQIYYFDELLVAAVGGASGGDTPPSDTTPPSQVTGVVVSSTTATTATLGWPASSDNFVVTGYQAEYCVGAGCTNYSNLLTTNTTSITFSGLTPGTTYQARVKAYDAAGNVSSSYSNTVSFTTSGAALPSMTTVDADSTGANVAWTGSPASIRVQTDSLNIVEPMSAFPVSSETIAHVQSRSVSGSGNSISLAYASNNTAGNFLALRLTASPSSVTISNCSDTRGNTWEAVPNATGGSGGYQAIRYAKDVLAGANTVTCTLTGAATFSTLDILEKSGVDRTSPLDQSKLTQQVDPGTGTDAISSGSVTTTADGELILGATLQVGATVYSASADFSGTQGPVWYYKDSSGANLSWTGTYWQGAGYLSLWDTGGHPGNPLDAMRRWVAPADGSVRITGTALNYSGCGSNGTIVTIKKNGTTLWTQLVTGTTSYPYDVSTTVVATDTLDFLINNNGQDICDSTQFDPTITLGTSSGSGGTTTLAGTGFTLRHATVSDSPSADQVQSTAGPIAATFTGVDALNDYITSIATFKPAASSIRYTKNWPIGTTFVCMFARDAAGNENAISPGYKCDSVGPVADTAPPIRSNGQPSGTLAAGTTSATISIVTDEAASCRYSTSAGIAYGSMVNVLDVSVNSLFHSKTISGLSDGNTYTYYVRCQDAFSNANLTDTVISFSVAAVAGDTTPPSKVTGLTGQALNASQISLLWAVATDNVGVAGYEVYIAALGIDYALGATTSSLSSVLSELSHSTLYLLKVRARDAVGNFGDYSDPLVILTPPSDVTAPSDVAGLVVGAVDFQALALSWTAGTDDVGIVSTNIEQCQGASCTDFLLVGTVTSGTTLRVSGLLPQTIYRFRAKHADAAGNVSLNYSPVVTGTTLAVPVGTVTAVCRCKHHR